MNVPLNRQAGTHGGPRAGLCACALTDRHGRPHVISAGGWTVQGWPVHQSDWKREVLRSVFSE